MAAEQPAERLRHEPRRRPGMARTPRHLAAVGEARFERRRRLAVQHRHLVAGPPQEVGAGYADDAGAEDEDFHRTVALPRQDEDGC